jgi:hypothetical protein
MTAGVRLDGFVGLVVLIVLGYGVLGTLALAPHEPQARPAIEAFLHHPDPAVRSHAADALAELPAPGNP